MLALSDSRVDDIPRNMLVLSNSHVGFIQFYKDPKFGWSQGKQFKGVFVFSKFCYGFVGGSMGIDYFKMAYRGFLTYSNTFGIVFVIAY